MGTGSGRDALAFVYRSNLRSYLHGNIANRANRKQRARTNTFIQCVRVCVIVCKQIIPFRIKCWCSVCVQLWVLDYWNWNGDDAT